MRASSWLIVFAAACGSSPAPSPQAPVANGTPAPAPATASPPAPAPAPSATPVFSAHDKAVIDDVDPSLSPARQVSAPADDGSGEYTGTAIQRGMKTHQGALRACYTKALKAHPGLAGKVVARFTIGADGAVTAVSAQGVDPDLDACLEQQIREIRFAAPDASVNVSYPLVFAS